MRAALSRTCLHCVLARLLRAESAALGARGLTLKLGAFEPLFLPARGAALYRSLRALLVGATRQATGGRLKLAVLDLPGKSHVEVTVSFAAGRRTRVLSCAFPRHDPDALGSGFAEHGESGWASAS